MGRTLKVTTLALAKKGDIPVRFGADPELIPETDDLVTQIVPVRSVDAVKLKTDLQPLVGSDADLASNGGSNSIIITDTSANVRRVVTIIASLDKKDALESGIRVRQLKYADATAAAKLITDIFKTPDQQAQGNVPNAAQFFRARSAAAAAAAAGAAGSAAAGAAAAAAGAAGSRTAGQGPDRLDPGRGRHADEHGRRHRPVRHAHRHRPGPDPARRQPGRRPDVLPLQGQERPGARHPGHAEHPVRRPASATTTRPATARAACSNRLGSRQQQQRFGGSSSGFGGSSGGFGGSSGGSSGFGRTLVQPPGTPARRQQATAAGGPAARRHRRPDRRRRRPDRPGPGRGRHRHEPAPGRHGQQVRGPGPRASSTSSTGPSPRC